MDTEPTFCEKCKILAPAGFFAWLIILGISLLINHEKWWINVIVTLVVVVIILFDMTTWRGEEYDPDRMP